MFCINCGNKIHDGAQFCSHCGSSQKQFPAEPKRATSSKATENKRKLEKIVWIIVAILVFAAIALVLIFVAFPDGIGNGNHDKPSVAIDREDRNDEDDRDDGDDRDDEDGRDDEADAMDEEPTDEQINMFAQDTESVDTTIHIGVSVPSLEYPYFAAMNNAVKNEFPKDGISVTVYNGENDQHMQNAHIEDMITKGVDGIVLIPITFDGAVPAVQDAYDAGISVVTVDRTFTAGMDANVVSFVGYDNYEMGVQAGELLIAGLEETFADAAQWNVAEIIGAPGFTVTTERGNGINDVLGKDDRINIISSLNGEFKSDTAASLAADALIAHPDLHAFICHNDLMAEGCYQALKNADRLGDVVVIGMDGQSSIVKKIVNGDIYGTILIHPGKMVLKGIELIVAYIEGNEVDDSIFFVPTDKVDPDNAQQYIDENLTW